MSGIKQAVTAMQVSKNRTQLQGFLGMAGFCHRWIPNFGLIAKPFYESLKGLDAEPQDWKIECSWLLKQPKRNCISTGSRFTQSLEDTQVIRAWKAGDRVSSPCPGAGRLTTTNNLLLQKGDQTTQGWPLCLQAVAATCDILQET